MKTVSLFQDENSSQNDYNSVATVPENAPLFQQWKVDSSILSIAEETNSVGLSGLRHEIYKQLGVNAASLEDAQAVKEIAHAIAKRAARLAGVALGAIVLQTGRLNPGASSNPGPKSSGAILEDIKSLNLAEAVSATANKLADTAGIAVNEEEIVDIGVDGSLVEFYPGFENYMREALRAIDGIGAAGERRIRIGIAHDGSGVGAALIALVAAKMEKTTGDYIGDLRRAAELVKDHQEGAVDDGLLKP
jgi:hexokinase